MAIKLPIAISFHRPMDRPDSPYGKCGHCEHVGLGIRKCPGCRIDLTTGGEPWPRPELIGLWADEVAMWNDQRVEMAIVTACTYVEASLFDLMWWRAGWFDPELNWIGAEFGVAQQKEEAVWAFVRGLRTRRATDRALKRLFGATVKQMLVQVLGREDELWFWANYSQMRESRNDVIHRGSRLVYRTLGTDWLVHKDMDDILAWCLEFVPRCWVVFAGLWNEYIHKPTLERLKKEGKC